MWPFNKVKCAECGMKINKKDAVQKDGKWYCKACAKKATAKPAADKTATEKVDK